MTENDFCWKSVFSVESEIEYDEYAYGRRAVEGENTYDYITKEERPELNDEYVARRCIFGKKAGKISRSDFSRIRSALDHAMINNTHTAFARFITENLTRLNHKEHFLNVTRAYSKPDSEKLIQPRYWQSPVVPKDKQIYYSKNAIKKWCGYEDDIPPRSVIVQMCLLWGTDHEEADHILRSSGYAALSPVVLRDLIYMYYLDHQDLQKNELIWEVKKQLDHFDLTNRNYDTNPFDVGGSVNDHICELSEHIAKAHYIYERAKEGPLQNVIRDILGDTPALYSEMAFPQLASINRCACNSLSSYQKNIFDTDIAIYADEKDTRGKSDRILVEGASSKWYELKKRDANNVKISEKLSILNTILKFNSVFWEECYLDGNIKQSSGKRSEAGKILYGRDNGKENVGVSKLELVRYMIAAGQEQNLGNYLVSSGFWRKNHMLSFIQGNDIALDEMDELDLLDYILIYAWGFRENIIKKNSNVNSLDEKTRKVQFPFIKLLMAIARDIQILICSAHEKTVDESSRNAAKKIDILGNYIPFQIHLQRTKKDGGRVVMDTLCADWIADYEWYIDLEKGTLG